MEVVSELQDSDPGREHPMLFEAGVVSPSVELQRKGHEGPNPYLGSQAERDYAGGSWL